MTAVIQSFLKDALRLCVDARECIAEISRTPQATVASSKSRRNPGKKKSGPHSTRPSSVRRLYQLVHSLKGTATLVLEARTVVEELHALEAALATGLADGGREWVAPARKSLDKVLRFLLDLENQSREPETLTARTPGIISRDTSGALLWFPIASLLESQAITQPLTERASNSTRIYCHQGVWIPVVRPDASVIRSALHSAVVILIVQTPTGRVAFELANLLGQVDWKTAQARGAKAPTQISDRKRQAA